MRSTLDARICHLLRVMRVVAPVEWNLGLPFPSNAVMADVGRVIELPELNFMTWLENRARARQSASSYRIERPLAA